MNKGTIALLDDELIDTEGDADAGDSDADVDDSVEESEDGTDDEDNEPETL